MIDPTTENRIDPESRRSERGSGLMLAILVVATMFTLIATSFIFLQQAKVSIHRQLSYDGQTLNAAQAGLIDGISWFRRQQVQPVGSFSPVRDLSSSPPINDTDDASIGLVREYEISDLGNVWGRYEVRVTETDDVSDKRGKNSTGAVWELTSHGIVYVRRDESQSFDQYPNSVITRAVARSEIQRLTLVPPANAAINAQRGDAVNTQSKTRVFGNGNVGIAYPPSTGSPVVGGLLAGSPTQSNASPYNDSILSVFGVTRQELVGMADVRVSSVSDLPPQIPDMAIVVINGNATFDSARPLRGVGVLVVFGSLTIASNSASVFNGLIYVEDDYVQGAPSSVTGSIIVGGDVDINGASDFSEVNYDGGILTQIQRHLGQYRFTRNQVFSRK